MGAHALVCAPLLAAEPRIKTAVLMVGGLGATQTEKIAARTLAFVERVETPVLLMGGRYDHRFPLARGQEPFMARLGTPEEDKKHRIFESAHWPLKPAYTAREEMINWLDHYLGPVDQ